MRILKKNLLFWAFFGGALVLSLNCAKQDVENLPLATFDGGKVTVKEYVTHYLKSTKYKPKQMPTEANLRKIVFNKAMEKIAVLEALADHVDQDSIFKRGYRNREALTLFQDYVQREMVNAVVTDSLIRKFYKEFTPQYQLFYIFRGAPKDASKRFARAQKDTIDWIYKKLQRGAKFQELARKYSQDELTAHKGGDAGFVIPESLGDPFVRKTFRSLPEDSFSKPFKGVGGYYIIYKGKKRDVPVPRFEEVRGKIWQTLYHTRRHQIQEKIDARFKELAPVYHYKVLQKTVDWVIKKAGKKEHVGRNWYVALNADKFSEKDLKKSVATYDGGVITLGDIFSDREKSPQDMWEFRKRLYEIAQERLFALDAKKKGYENFPDVQKRLQTIRNGLLRQAEYEKHIMSKVAAGLDSIRAEQGKKLTPSALHDLILQKRAELEELYRGRFEDAMIKKYHFRFVKENFKKALKFAKEKKLEAVKKAKESA